MQPGEGEGGRRVGKGCRDNEGGMSMSERDEAFRAASMTLHKPRLSTCRGGEHGEWRMRADCW